MTIKIKIDRKKGIHLVIKLLDVLPQEVNPQGGDVCVKF